MSTCGWCDAPATHIVLDEHDGLYEPACGRCAKLGSGRLRAKIVAARERVNWSADEIDILGIAVRFKKSRAQIESLLPGRPWESIRCRIRYMREKSHEQ